MPSLSMKKALKDIYTRLADHYGPTRWWPGDSPFEVAVGAILTQNTAWSNVEKAIVNLKRERLLTPRRMMDAPLADLEEAIRPSGYYRQKAERLRIFCAFLLRGYRGRMSLLMTRPLAELREALLALKGIGPETADAMLLYACEKPVFVVDAYTIRIFHRAGLVAEDIRYEALQRLVHEHLTPALHLYKEFHGLLVWTGKDYCRKTPRCEGCPLAVPGVPGRPFPCHKDLSYTLC